MQQTETNWLRNSTTIYCYKKMEPRSSIGVDYSCHILRKKSQAKFDPQFEGF